MSYKLYKITCSTTGKCYIGFTSTPLKVRMRHHFNDTDSTKPHHLRRKLMIAIREHGREAFTIEQLCEVETKQEASDMEKLLIAKYNTFEDGYNGTMGGVGVGPEVPRYTDIEQLRQAVLKRKMHFADAPNLLTTEARGKMKQRKLDEHVKAQEVEVNGVKYRSMRQACKELNTTMFLLNKYFETGVLQQGKPHIPKNYVVDKMVFPSRQAAADYFNVNIHNLASFIARREKLTQKDDTRCPSNYFDATLYLRRVDKTLHPYNFLESQKVSAKIQHPPVIYKGRNARTFLHNDDKPLFDAWILMVAKTT